MGKWQALLNMNLHTYLYALHIFIALNGSSFLRQLLPPALHRKFRQHSHILAFANRIVGMACSLLFLLTFRSSNVVYGTCFCI